MRNVILFLLLLLSSIGVNAQFILHVKVLNKEKQPLDAVSLTLYKKDVSVESKVTSIDGTASFKLPDGLGKYNLQIAHIGYTTSSVLIDVVNTITEITFELEQKSYSLDPLEIKSLSVSDKAPFAATNISKDEIAKNNLGQDLPFLLDQSPSVVVNSDAGNGVGYTGLRIRGSDATRINITINGIPYNDAESQGTFFVNIPDILSSVSSVQIQRGVGSSSNGAGAFGASIHLSTNEVNALPYAETNNSYGSFNTFKNTVKVGSGILNKQFTIDARLSRISSNGFIERASSDLKSAYLSAAYTSINTSIRFNFISGKEKTYQAWYGIPQNKLSNDRTFNSAGTEKPGDPYDNETDNYGQDHYQLFLNQKLNSSLTFNTALFLSKGKGYYEQYKADALYSSYGLANPVINSDTLTSTDLIRQLWLDNSYYGQIFSLQYKTKPQQIILGGGWTRYLGNHFGKVIWAKYNIDNNLEYYRLNALKTDVNLYAKWQYVITDKVDLFTELQYRTVSYDMNGFRNNPEVIVNRKFNFFNPKAGIAYNYKGYKAFVSYAVANKEPNRDDFEAGKQRQPQHETLHDVEAGIEKKSYKFSWSATGYFMNYRNQLILTGRINDVGAYARENVPESYRMGLELQGKVNCNKWLSIAANFAISKNKIKNSDEYIDDYDNGGQIKISHNNTTIALSPQHVASMTLHFIPIKNAAIHLISKYVGSQYLDNTQNDLRKLNSYLLQDLKLSYTLSTKFISQVDVICAVNNLMNRKYEPNGYTFSYFYNNKTTTENFYYPMAGRNFMAGLNIRF